MTHNTNRNKTTHMGGGVNSDVPYYTTYYLGNKPINTAIGLGLSTRIRMVEYLVGCYTN